jgi:amidohydrolase
VSVGDDSELTFLRCVRRAVHRRPELGHQEHRTAAFVERILARLGLAPFRPAPTSVAAVVGVRSAAPAIGFRADLDALPISEATNAPYASRNPGVMHACGHDGHTAALLTLARRLATDPLRRRPVLLVFQQAEEGVPSGAPKVLQALPRSLRPPEFFGFHLWPELPVGTVGTRPGPMLASVAGITIEVSGRAGRAHGTMSGAGGVDALAVAVRLYTELNAAAPGRILAEGRPAALGIGQLEAGREPNLVPTHGVLRGSLRALSWSSQDTAVARLRQLVAAVAADTGAQIDLLVESGIRPPVWNAVESVARLRAACEHLAVRCLEYPDRPLGVSDDFGWYLDGGLGALFLLGCAAGESHPDLHTPLFDFDEHALLTAVDVLEVLATGLD